MSKIIFFELLPNNDSNSASITADRRFNLSEFTVIQFCGFRANPNAFERGTFDLKRRLVRRELLVGAGDGFDEQTILESVRNLRRLGIFNLVAALPAYDPQKKVYGLLVVTRDLWSLRVESNFQFTGSTIDRLNAQLTERNLLDGENCSYSLWAVPFELLDWCFYLDPRMGKKLRLQLGADTIFRRANHDYNGFQTTVGVSRPFYSLGHVGDSTRF